MTTTPKICSAEGCDREVVARGLCARCYQRAKFGVNKNGPPRRKGSGPYPVTALAPINGTCGVEGCGRPLKQKGMCALHYQRAYHYGDVGDAKPTVRQQTRVPCSVEGCSKEARARGLCMTHYRRFQVSGDPGPAELMVAPKGTGYVGANGYRVIAGRLEHQIVMEKVLGRPLRANENVHHRDGDRLNNDPANLELWVIQQPVGQRATDLVGAAIAFLRDNPEKLRIRGLRLLTLESSESTDMLLEDGLDVFDSIVSQPVLGA